MLNVKDHGGVESCIEAHFEGNSWRFENMKTISGNGPVGTFSCFAIYNIDFGTRKNQGNIEISKLLKMHLGEVSNLTKSTLLNNFR